MLYVVALLVFLRVGWAQWSYSRWQYVENRDPRDVFQQVFHVDPPASVTNISAAGHQPFNGSLWMLIRTTDIDGLLKAIGTSPSPPGGETRERAGIELYEPRTNDERAYAASVQWESAHHIKQPEYYQFPRDGGGGSGWAGVLVVDRKGHSIHVAAEMY